MFRKNKLVLHLYAKLLLIRKVEEAIIKVYPTDVIQSPVHLSIGQEAVAVGVCDLLEREDWISNSCRCHATYLAKGGDLNKMFAELYGKKTGCAAGKAGSMHLVDKDNGVLGASAIIGSNISICAGVALKLKLQTKAQQQKNLVVAFFGDGATEEGTFTETINFAAIHKLPIIFICENNGLAIHSPLKKRWANLDICKRVQSYGIKTYKVTDGNIFKIRNAAKKAIYKIKKYNAGPIFIECNIYRYLEHVGIRDDHHEDYRNIFEYEKWQKRDAVKKLENMLSPKEVVKIKLDINAKIKSAIEFAKNSPAPNEVDFYKNIYA